MTGSREWPRGGGRSVGLTLLCEMKRGRVDKKWVFKNPYMK